MTEHFASHFQFEDIDESLWDTNIGDEEEGIWSPTYIFGSSPLFANSSPTLVDANVNRSPSPSPPLRPPRNPDRLLHARSAFNTEKYPSNSSLTSNVDIGADISIKKISRPRTATGISQSNFKSQFSSGQSSLLSNDVGVLTKLKEVREHIGASTVGSVTEIKNYAFKLASRKPLEKAYRSLKPVMHTNHARTFSVPSSSAMQHMSTEQPVLATSQSNAPKSQESLLERGSPTGAEERMKKQFMKTYKSLKPLFHANHTRTSSPATASGEQSVIDISQPILIISSPKTATSEESIYADNLQIVAEEETEKDPYYNTPMLSSVSLTSLNGTEPRHSNLSPNSIRDILSTNSLPIKSWMHEIKPLQYSKKDPLEMEKGASFIHQFDTSSIVSEDSKRYSGLLSFGTRFKDNVYTGFESRKGFNPIEFLRRDPIETFGRRSMDTSRTDELTSFLPL